MEPPEAQTQAIAFSSESWVITRLGRRSSTSTLITSSPIFSATLPFSSSSAGTIAEPPGLIPSASKAQAIVLAVNWPPQAPAPGLATPSRSRRSSSLISPAAWVADRLEDVEDRHVVAVPAAGGDRAAVEHHRGHVEPSQGHHATRDRLVAGRERHDRVELVAAGHQLDRVSDHLAADQRGLHPLGSHRDPVGDRDRVELQRGTPCCPHTRLDVLGEAAQMEIAGHRFGPGVGDADRRPAEGIVVEADALHVGARGGAIGTVEDDAGARAREAARCGAVRAHGLNLVSRSTRCRREHRRRGRRRQPGRPRHRSPLRPAPTAAEVISLALRAASRGVSPRARKAASAEECVQPEPCEAPSG